MGILRPGLDYWARSSSKDGKSDPARLQRHATPTRKLGAVGTSGGFPQVKHCVCKGLTTPLQQDT